MLLSERVCFSSPPTAGIAVVLITVWLLIEIDLQRLHLFVVL